MKFLLGIDQLPKLVKDSLTLADGVTYDVGRAIAVAVFMAFLGFTGYDLIGLHNAFNGQNFGIGAGSLAAGLGALLNLKHKTEPKCAEGQDVPAA